MNKEEFQHHIDVCAVCDFTDPSIRKTHHTISFNTSKASSVCQTTRFDFYSTGGGGNMRFYADKPSSENSDRHVIMTRKEDVTRIAMPVKLQKAKANISKEQIFEKIKLRTPYLNKIDRADLFTLDKDFLLIKGTFYYSYGLEDYAGDEYPYFGVVSQSDGTLTTEAFEELLHVLMIDGEYYFVSWFQEPECGKRGLRIHTIDGKFLKEVFSDNSEAS